MKVLILKTAEEATERAADLVTAAVRQKPDIVLGLATGGTMLPLYQALRRKCREDGTSFARSRTFNLDEYVGLSPEHPCSYHRYMRDELFDHIDIDLANTHLPAGDASDPVIEADRYEALIANSGGIDLQLLGIGRNGHIGFNEPTSSLGSRTRIKTLTEDTRRANQRYFSRYEDIPRFAITMGVATILESRTAILLATGAAKQAAVAAMIEGPISASCPASALQLHRNATIVLDASAAGSLELMAYYQHVHPDGAASVFE